MDGVMPTEVTPTLTMHEQVNAGAVARARNGACMMLNSLHLSHDIVQVQQMKILRSGSRTVFKSTPDEDADGSCCGPSSLMSKCSGFFRSLPLPFSSNVLTRARTLTVLSCFGLRTPPRELREAGRSLTWPRGKSVGASLPPSRLPTRGVLERTDPVLGERDGDSAGASLPPSLLSLVLLLLEESRSWSLPVSGIGSVIGSSALGCGSIGRGSSGAALTVDRIVPPGWPGGCGRGGISS